MFGGGECYGIDVGPGDGLLDLGLAAEHGQRADPRHVDAGSRTRTRQAHPDDRVAVSDLPREVLDQVDDRPRVSDRQHRDRAPTPATLPHQELAAQVAPEDQTEEPQRQTDGEVAAGIVWPQDHQGDRDDADRCQRRGQHA